MLDELKAFIAVVDTTSLTKAADRLSLTQSAVSRRVQQLEDLLGTPLLDRSTRPPTATAVGRRIHQSGSAILRDIDRLKRLARDDEAPSGTFRIGLPQVIADVALFEIAMRLRTNFPALDLRCRTDWSTALQKSVANGDLDAAVLMLPSGSVPPAGTEARHIATFDVLVVQSRHAPVVPERSSIAQLADSEWILNPQGCGYRAALQRAMEGAGKQLRLGVDVHGTETQLRLVAAGMGLGLAPRSLLAASSHLPGLSLVEVDDFSLTLDLWLAHAHALGNLGQALEVLHQALTEPSQAEDASSPGAESTC
ncbi:LysR family transcriptional regulator [Roseateles sp.]|uniref:LysR family transcriptional regulator n=1 Tax=Roseateles sp. TaxID=1971397 RepID=UPI002F3E6A9A